MPAAASTAVSRGLCGAAHSRECHPVAISQRSQRPLCASPLAYDRYLVDSASSHMLVSKIKPCMSKYKQSYCETANGSLNQL